MLIKREAIILEMGRDINTLLNGRFANHLFHLHESHIIFYPPYLYSVMPMLYRAFSCTPRNPSLHPFQIPFPENLHLSMLNELWMVLYNQEKSTSLIPSPCIHGIQSHDSHHTRVGWRYYRNPTFGCESCGVPVVPVDVNRKSTESCRVIAYFLATLHGEICSCNRRLSH